MRQNCYRNNKSPDELLREAAPAINPKELLLPVIDLDLALEFRVKSNMLQTNIGVMMYRARQRFQLLLLDT